MIIEGAVMGEISMMSSVVPENVWGAAKAAGAGKKLIATTVDNRIAPRIFLFTLGPFTF